MLGVNDVSCEPDMHPFQVPHTFIPGIEPPADAIAHWFAFVGQRLLVEQTPDSVQIPQLKSLSEIGLEPVRIQFLGWLDGQPCYSAELSETAIAPAGMAFSSLRELHEALTEPFFALAARAVQIVAWDRSHQYCGHCATPMIQLAHERAKRCPSCGLRQYPRLSPAIIVLVYRGEEVLLARSPRFRPGMYSVLAGFVEPGESLEDTVAREVREEVGVAVKDIRYFGSQPWPFPDSLMIGFTAAYAGGDLVCEPAEIEAAAWFKPHDLPPIPGKLSIARKLIDAFVAAASRSDA